MPLQQLVEYFNDRLEREHNSPLRPFTIQDDKVFGNFGQIRVGSEMLPLRETLRNSQIAGYAAHIHVTGILGADLTRHESDSLKKLPIEQTSDTEAIISFDRLTRTVHMLNYLPQSHLDDLLILDVDPRHILGVKADHGAYFEEIIIKCGLKTRNVAIGLKINNEYARVYPSLLKGLYNYQNRGYRVALKFDYFSLDKSAFELISRASPDLVAMSSQHLDSIRDNRLPEKLNQLCQLVSSMEGCSVMLGIDDKRNATLARQMGFNLVQGAYFEAESFDLISEGL
ncbi:EAL domain-containing protein [Methylomonas sp. LL1]|uniref:EAL domain-containing protein n=1 Tax=Methylomonas sp. LL1 TaxID=2785785 RepID=UPI0018C41B1E|nr:EAL domain-containing protein [Methylomonas sp. LL1]QPK64848.1 EAL domain-containing protein [Methylomonas sp. LL1]